MTFHALTPTQGTDLEKMVFFDQGTQVLYVSKNNAFEAPVRSYMQLLNEKSIRYEVQSVAMDVIHQKRLLNDNAKSEVMGRSDMQRAATEIFKVAVERRASDIHIRVASKSHTKIIFRVHGDLELYEEHPASWGKLLCSAIYTGMSDISDATFEELSRQDARISVRENLSPGLDGIRIATTPQVDGLVMVLRLLYNDEGKSIDICDYGYTRDQQDLIDQMRSKPTGINIISGPTGSGKSTTLRCTLLTIHKECHGTKNIMTVEDPPEYSMPGIVQTPVANAKTEQERSAAFQEAIKATMRLDPNVIMIGEMRDTPSASLGMQAAMTGHQVWTSVHANNAFSVIDRMVDLGISSNVMTDDAIITGIICQRLIKVLCPSCKRPLASVLERYAKDDLERVMKAVDVSSAHVIGDGCPECRGRGISGMTAAAEVVVPDEPMMDLIRSGQKARAIEYWRGRGGRTMREMAIDKINDGLCDPFKVEEEIGPLSDMTLTFAGDGNDS
ncbi:GspE/PulE family protein [Polaromonas aquatica]|uniref:GspE/PulE family protein n=1 Tax=Polaromonas aquatica TaxID=332657 RepID=A0ABW1TV79_9BURK